MQTTQVGDDLAVILPRLGARVTRAGGALTVDGGAGIRGGATIPGLDLDLSTGGELAPAIVALLAFADGPSRVTGIGHLRGHETDRLAALATELNRLGGAVTELEDGLAIDPRPLHGDVWRSYEDHRMATAGALVGLVVEGVEVDDIGTTAKTLPQFPELWREPARARRTARRHALGAVAAVSWLPPDSDDDDGDFAGWDESDAKVRPNPKGNRPRTKIRPEHGDAVEARVLSVDRGRYTVLVDDGGPDEHVLLGKRARELRNQAIVTGDVVDIVGDTSGDEGTLGRIVRIRPRETVLRRSADDTDTVERVVVANADQLLIVVATAEPGTAAAARRPLPRRGLRRRHRPAPGDDQDRPRRPGTVPRELRGPRLPGVPQLPRPLADRGARARARGPPHGRGRALRGRQVDPRERARARNRSGSRLGQPRDRPRPSHLVVDGLAAGADRRMDHRHPGHPLVRAGARRSGEHHQGVPRPRRCRRRMPARLHAPARRPRLRPQRGRRARRAERGAGGLAAAAAHHARSGS